jgi:hypothetical protein
MSGGREPGDCAVCTPGDRGMGTHQRVDRARAKSTITG